MPNGHIIYYYSSASSVSRVQRCSICRYLVHPYMYILWFYFQIWKPLLLVKKEEIGKGDSPFIYYFFTLQKSANCEYPRSIYCFRIIVYAKVLWFIIIINFIIYFKSPTGNSKLSKVKRNANAQNTTYKTHSVKTR